MDRSPGFACILVPIKSRADAVMVATLFSDAAGYKLPLAA
jgi:hypothetical protein